MIHGRVVGLPARVDVAFRRAGQPSLAIEFVVDPGFEGGSALPFVAVTAAVRTGADQEAKSMSDRETAQFRATAGALQGFGGTPQEALAALMQRLCGAAPVPIVIWPYNHGDAFFTEEQQTRLQALKQRQETLTAEERAELEEM
jgi:hypothetical protein